MSVKTLPRFTWISAPVSGESLEDYPRRASWANRVRTLFQSVDPAGRRLTGRALLRWLVLAGDDHAAGGG